jgi:hypothetical protein
LHAIKRCGTIGCHSIGRQGVVYIVFFWFHQSSSPPIVWGRGGGVSRWNCTLCITVHSWSFALRWPGPCAAGCGTSHPPCHRRRC